MDLQPSAVVRGGVGPPAGQQDAQFTVDSPPHPLQTIYRSHVPSPIRRGRPAQGEREIRLFRRWQGRPRDVDQRGRPTVGVHHIEVHAQLRGMLPRDRPRHALKVRHKRRGLIPRIGEHHSGLAQFNGAGERRQPRAVLAGGRKFREVPVGFRVASEDQVGVVQLDRTEA